MSRKILNPFCSVDQSSIPSMKYGDRMGCPLREHLKNINAVCKFFNKKSVQIVEADSHISD